VRGGVVVVGGANMDVHARSAAGAVMRTSNPGVTTLSPGGVGRNIAETIARLGTPTALVSVVGDDALGDDVLARTRDAGVDCAHVQRRAARTGTYTAMLDADGELVAAVADMAATDELGPATLDAAEELIASAALLVVDGNLRAEAVAYAFDLAARHGVDVAVDPVSVPKAPRVRAALRPDRPVAALTPNADELAALTGLPVGSDAELRAAVAALHARGVASVWLRLGGRGSWFSGAAGSATGAGTIVELPPYATSVIDVTGAGDAAMGGFCHALVAGSEPLAAARYGQAAAALTVASEHTVRPDLTDELVRRML
jgi:pseudouridine kinase